MEDLGRDTKRCPWCGEDPLYQQYHDQIWGKPRRESQDLFAKLCLDGQQAGLSWITILRKEKTYYEAYDDFDPKRIVQYDEAKIAALLANPGIIRNKLKVNSIIKNARAYLEIEKNQGDFSQYIWSFVGGEPIVNHWHSMKEVPAFSPESEAMSKALKKKGFTFVGPTICYAFMQAVGMVNDHLLSCPEWERSQSL